jgi:hypothetical protein
MILSDRAIIAAIVENIITLCVFALVVIFAPGAWKWAGVACLLNINSIRIKKDAQ